MKPYVNEIQDEALKSIGARYRRDIRLMLYGTIFGLVLLTVLLAISLNQEAQLHQQLAESQKAAIAEQKHTQQLLIAIKSQTGLVESDIQCTADLFASQKPGTVIIANLGTCQTVPASSPMPIPSPLIPVSSVPSPSTPTPSSNKPTNQAESAPTRTNSPSPSPTPQPVQNILNTIFNSLNHLF